MLSATRSATYKMNKVAWNPTESDSMMIVNVNQIIVK